jgi:hypothetical protein
MSDAESLDTQSDEHEAGDVNSATPGSVPEDAPASQPKKPLITVSRVILFGMLSVAVFMFIQDRRASSAWSEVHEWLKEQELKAIESGAAAAIKDIRKHMEDDYGLYPEDHLNLPIEYYRWSTWVREFTIEIQINSRDQLLARHAREIRYNWMDQGQYVIDEDVKGGQVPPPGEAPTPPSIPGGGSGGPPEG